MSTPTAVAVRIDQPGVYDLPAEAYHADPVAGGSLSSSGARALLPPSCPARFRYDRDHGSPDKLAWDIGHAAHKVVLGAGPELVVVPGVRWDTKAAKAAVAEARERGAVPLKEDQYDMVQAMAAALRVHPIAAALLNPQRGEPERALFWRDAATGVWCRTRLDWYPQYSTYRDARPIDGRGHPGRVIIPDYKTCHSAEPEKLSKSVYDFGYHQQAAWCLDGFRATCPAGRHPNFDAAFVFICQEKTPPFLVTVIEPDAMALRIGAHRNRRAIELYRACVDSGRWPGYSDDVELVSLPGWAETRYVQENW